MTQSASPRVAEGPSDDQIRATVLEMILEMGSNADGEHGPDTTLVEDLGYHSLALIELAFALEDEFDLEPIDEAAARHITTIGKIQDLVIERVRKTRSTG